MKRWISGFVLGGLLMLSVPAFAHLKEHVPSTDPITSMSVRMFSYQTKEALVCDTPDPTGMQFRSGHIEGVELFDFPSMRMHLNINSARHGLDPTEHWDVHVDVSQAIAKNNGQLAFRTLWDQNWKHQNTTGHQKSHLAVKTNLWRLNDRPGTWKVTFTLEGQESGNTFEHVCIFETV